MRGAISIPSTIPTTTTTATDHGEDERARRSSSRGIVDGGGDLPAATRMRRPVPTVPHAGRGRSSRPVRVARSRSRARACAGAEHAMRGRVSRGGGATRCRVRAAGSRPHPPPGGAPRASRRGRAMAGRGGSAPARDGPRGPAWRGRRSRPTARGPSASCADGLSRSSARRSTHLARGRRKCGPWRRSPRRRPVVASLAISARSGTTISAAAEGVAARTSAAKSASVTSTSWPTPQTTGTGWATTARTTRSSLNAHRSSSEPPPRARIVTAGASSGRPSAAGPRRSTAPGGETQSRCSPAPRPPGPARRRARPG